MAAAAGLAVLLHAALQQLLRFVEEFERPFKLVVELPLGLEALGQAEGGVEDLVAEPDAGVALDGGVLQGLVQLFG